MNLKTALNQLANEAGANFFGVADLTPAPVRAAVESQGGSILAQFPRALSAGIPLVNSVVDQLPYRSELPIAMLYEQACYETINQRLDHLASRLGNTLQNAGYLALPIPASTIVDRQQLYGHFSHKMAAHLAGLGWIGKSCLLITPQTGPRLRWVTVLTNAPLAVGSPLDERCGDCHKCAEICPVQAINGRSFREDEPLQMRLDAQKCDSYRAGLKSTSGYPTCGLCLYICPFGKKE